VFIVKSLERKCIPVLGLLDKLGFVRVTGLRLIWVGQVAYSGRNPSDAANYLYVVWLAGSCDETCVISKFKFQEQFYDSLDFAGFTVDAGNLTYTSDKTPACCSY
jgi:hypothetical protein